MVFVQFDENSLINVNVANFAAVLVSELHLNPANR